MDKDTGGNAFPWTGAGLEGMSLRDWFAGQAMQAFLDRQRYSLSDEKTAEWAYAMADAMLKARKK